MEKNKEYWVITPTGIKEAIRAGGVWLGATPLYIDGKYQVYDKVYYTYNEALAAYRGLVK
jgi:hypothetical protein